MSIFRRLFKEHWGLTLVFGIFWFLIVTLAVSGPEDPRKANIGFLLVLWTIPVILVSFAWMNAGQYQKVERIFRRRALTWGSAIADFIVFAILFAIPGAILAPAYGNYAVRSRMNEMINSVSALQAGIAEVAQSNGRLYGAAAEFKITKPKNSDYALLSPDGMIVLYNEQHGALAVLNPVMSNGVVAWRCQGFPAGLFPRNCHANEKNPETSKNLPQ